MIPVARACPLPWFCYEGPVRPARNLVVLTGAGISRESGLHTFRDADGVWAQVRIEDVATPEAFAADPERVHAFYNSRRRQLLSLDIQPNAAHRALSRLEAAWPGDFLLVTQNIDDLHERSGSRKLVHMHGELLKVRCDACRGIAEWRTDLGSGAACPICGERGRLRPRVVWFGEVPLELDRIFDAVGACDLFVAIGTSGQVQPAAGLVSEAARNGAQTVELNLESSSGTSLFDRHAFGPATRIVPEFVDRLLDSLKGGETV
ncbi:MAG: Sir2 family NAD+-dependent deacetylase [Opitutaceae bacterium]